MPLGPFLVIFLVELIFKNFLHSHVFWSKSLQSRSQALNLIEMKKLVVKVEMRGDKDKKKAMKSVTGISGIDSVTVDMKEKKMIVVGDVDPVEVIKTLRKSFYAEIVTVETARREKKDGYNKKEWNKEKKDGDKNKREAEQKTELDKCNKYNNPSISYKFNHSAEENPNACVIL